MIEKPKLGQRVLGVALAVAFVAASLAFKLLPWWALAMTPGASKIFVSLSSGTVALALTVTMTWLAGRFWPTMAQPGLALHPRPRDLRRIALGLALGGLLFIAVYTVARLVGGVEVVWLGHSPAKLASMMLFGFAATVLNACWEEYAFRGWPFAVCARAVGPHGVALGLGAIFGLAHVFNAQWVWQASVSTALAGLLLGYGMLAAGGIAFPMGLHVGWNYVQSLLGRRYWRWQPHPSILRSGGRYGLEASLAGIAITGAAAVALGVVFVRSERSAGPQASCTEAEVG